MVDADTSSSVSGQVLRVSEITFPHPSAESLIRYDGVLSVYLPVSDGLLE